MNKFTFIYLIFVYALFSIFTLNGDIGMGSQVIGSLILIFIFGIPHGAIDNIIYLSSNKITRRRFYLIYILTIIVYCIFWWLVPIISLVIFLLLSSYHFGESQFVEYSFAFKKRIIYLFWGFALLSTLIFYNNNELLSLSNQFIDTQIFSQVFNILIFKYIFYFSNAIIISMLIFENYKLSISNQQLMNEIFLLILIHITFYLFPIIISFTLYFIFLHSIKVLKQEFDYLKSLQSDLNLFKFIKLLYPHTLLSIIFLAIFLLLMNFGYINISVFLFSIIGISVITLPHAIIMSNFYNEINVK
ncbi:Brp/Blh family beta-carotene 15,15'-dioxygenase [Flavobacteriales bacterium]|nr:Brp/Blh family beta-carotene 15,15'-dioxygenase [Flavobacteriales bacterium]